MFAAAGILKKAVSCSAPRSLFNRCGRLASSLPERPTRKPRKFRARRCDLHYEVAGLPHALGQHSSAAALLHDHPRLEQAGVLSFGGRADRDRALRKSVRHDQTCGIDTLVAPVAQDLSVRKMDPLETDPRVFRGLPIKAEGGSEEIP